MHMVDGEQGHSHGHCHDHEHCHGHEHEEQKCGGCAGGCGQKPASEQEAVLAYMLDHNRHHAAELTEMAKQFKTSGNEEAAVQIEKAVEDFEKGNLRLSVALSLVRAGQQ